METICRTESILLRSNRRRLDTNTDSNTVLQQNANDIVEIEQSETAIANFHGLHYCFSIEPEVGGANANGFWVLLCLPAGLIQRDDLPETFGELADDTRFSPYIWGLGCWTASNEAPYHMEFAPKTSRNCEKGARVIAYVIKDGISSGAVRIVQTLTLFST